MRFARDPFSVAGWLFADLLLALWVFSAATGTISTSRASPSPTVTPTPTLSPTVTRTPSPTPSDAAIAVASVCRTFKVSIDGLLSPQGSDRYEQARLGAIADMTSALVDLKGQRVALVLTFATAASTTRAGDLAKVVNTLAKSPEVDARLAGLFRSAQTRDYIFETPQSDVQGQIYLEMFLPPPLPANTKSDVGCPR